MEVGGGVGINEGLAELRDDARLIILDIVLA